MAGADLFLFIQVLNDVSERMERILDRDGFLVNGEYPISGYTVEEIRNMCNQTLEIINSTDFVPNHGR